MFAQINIFGGNLSGNFFGIWGILGKFLGLGGCWVSLIAHINIYGGRKGGWEGANVKMGR